MSLGMLAERTGEWFAKCFGQEPKSIVAAPGRVNLIGEHTDYNEGFVLPIALDRYTVIAARPKAGKNVTIHNVTTGDTAEFQIGPRLSPGEPAWSNYVRGVIRGFLENRKKVRGFDAVIDSDVPLGAGLASSAALAVATATALEAMGGYCLDPRQKALLCQQAEHDFAGVPCGIMDQFNSIMARQDTALLLDCRTLSIRSVTIRPTGVAVLVVNTRVRHKNAETEYAQRREQCLAAAKALGVRALRDATMPMLRAGRSKMSPVVFRRARHVITENERTLKAAAKLEEMDWPAVGKLMFSSHDSLRDDYEVSSLELDTVVEIARKLGSREGVFGCRMTGAGFGGSAVALVEVESVPHLIRGMSESYADKTGEEAEIFATRPSAGARIL